MQTGSWQPIEGKPTNTGNRSHYDIDVTRTELSADPVKKIGKVGCQSTVVIAALWGRVLSPFI